MHTPVILAQADSAFLVGWWLALLMYLPFIPWAWLVSVKLDKDARYFHLNHHMWNGIHLGCGVAALLAMVLTPVPGVGLFIGILFLGTPILVYWKIRNQSVPDSHKYALTGQSLSERLEARKAAKASREAAIHFIDHGGKTRDIPARETPVFATHMVAEDVLGPALEARSSRIEMTVGASGAAVSQTIDGVKYKRDSVAQDAALGLIDYLKDLAGLDVSDRRRRQAGKFSLKGPTGAVTMDLTTAGSSSGQLIRIDFDRSKRLSRPYDNLGLLPSQIESLKSLGEQHDRHGVVLLGAPSAHGLTTTGYSFIGRHDAYTANIKTIEREVQLRLDGVDHIEFDATNPDVDFAGQIQSILRRDPDVVLTDIIKDAETAQVIIEPGMQGPLIYVPQVSPTIVDQIRQWVRHVGDVKTAVKPLRAVTNQRLMRTLCPNCKQAYQPSPEQLKKLNLPADRAKQLYRSSGKVQVKNKVENCPVCGGTGYLGQTAAFEVFIIDDQARKILGSGDLKGALSHARRNKMIYLQEAALSRVINGETTIEEVIRATSVAKSEATAAA